MPNPGEKLLDLVEEAVVVTGREQVIPIGELHVPGPRNAGSQIAPVFNRDIAIVDAMQN